MAKIEDRATTHAALERRLERLGLTGKEDEWDPDRDYLPLPAKRGPVRNRLVIS